MGDGNKAEYGQGNLYVKHGKWYGRWRSPAGVRRNWPVKVDGVTLCAEGKDKTSRRDARKALSKMMEDDGASAPVDGRQVTVRVLGDKLLAALEIDGASTSHKEAVESAIRVHLVPHFGATPVEKITKASVEELVRKLVNTHAPKSIRNYCSILHSMLDLAIEDGFHAGPNPVKAARKPKVRKRTAVRFLTLEELDGVIACASDDDVGRMERVLWRTSAMVGLRMGETRGFRWHHIDWFAQRVRIEETFVRGEFKGPKSERGFRSVPLPQTLMRELEAWSKATAYNAESDLVFCHPHTGNPYDGSRALKRFKAACKRAGYTKVVTNKKTGKPQTVASHCLHDLRHTFGTRCASRGIPLRTIQEWMGHEDSDTTEIYAAYQPAKNEAALIDAAFAPEPVGEPEPADERQEV